jgi:hypothetical protein
MYKKFKKYKENKEKTKDNGLFINEEVQKELNSKIESTKDLKTFKNILEKKQRQSNVKQDDLLVEKWKHARLQEYLTPAKKIHTILNTINKDCAQGVDFYFMEGAECFYRNQAGVVLFGSVKTKFGKIEAKVFIKNPKRLVYVFPKRDAKLEDVEAEVRESLGKDQQVVRFSRVKKKYCFEINLDYRYGRLFI